MNPHQAGAALAAFLASFVECLEALTIVLAIGATRGWRNALTGAAAACILLATLVAALGPRAAFPAAPLRLLVGILTLAFGLRWLRKAILRAAGRLPLRDEAQAYNRTTARLRTPQHAPTWDRIGLATAFQIVMVEGIEVVLIVAAVGAGGGQFRPAAIGATAAFACILALGALLHRPITRVPENTLKFGVAVMLCAFGTFWAGEALGLRWPGGEWGLPLLSLLWGATSLTIVWTLKRNKKVLLF